MRKSLARANFSSIEDGSLAEIRRKLEFEFGEVESSIAVRYRSRFPPEVKKVKRSNDRDSSGEEFKIDSR